MKTAEVIIEYKHINKEKTVNVVVPDDFSTWTAESQLKYLFGLRYIIDISKGTIYSDDAIASMRIVNG